jgi:riboflavin synthase
VFTGIVEALGEVAAIADEPPGARLVVRAPSIAAEARLGESIAVNGCCLTVVGVDHDRLTFQAGPETLGCTNLGGLAAGDGVNLERAVRPADRLGGHFVSGHVDGVATLDALLDSGDFRIVWFRAPPELMRYVVPKGSVAVDGVSLTVVDVEAERFSVMLIPHTLAVTTLGRRGAGERVNVEADLLAKYTEKLLAERLGPSGAPQGAPKV